MATTISVFCERDVCCLSFPQCLWNCNCLFKSPHCRRGRWYFCLANWIEPVRFYCLICAAWTGPLFDSVPSLSHLWQFKSVPIYIYAGRLPVSLTKITVEHPSDVFVRFTSWTHWLSWMSMLATLFVQVAYDTAKLVSRFPIFHPSPMAVLLPLHGRSINFVTSSTNW